MLLSIFQQIWKTQLWPQDWKMSDFIPIPKKVNAKECSNYCTIALSSHASKVMLKILQAKLQQYMNWELQMYKLDFKKAEEPEIKLPTSVGSEKKQGDSKKQSASLTTWKPLALDHNKLWRRDGNTKSPYLSPKKPVYRARSNSQNKTWNNGLVQNWERSMSSLYIVTLLI